MNSMRTFMEIVSKMNGTLGTSSTPTYKVGQFVKANTKRLTGQLCKVVEVHPNHLVVESKYWVCNVPMKFIEPMELSKGAMKAAKAEAAEFCDWVK